MLTREQLEARRSGVGGSDTPAIFGLSSYKTEYQLYLDKRGEVPIEDDEEPNEARDLGNLFEPVIRQLYCNRTGLVVRDPGQVRSERYPWMIGNFDGVADGPRVVEIKKWRSGSGFGEDGSDEIPVAHMLQVQHYLIVTGFERADVAALLWGSSFRVYPIQADAELQEQIIDTTHEFWQRVKSGDPPDPVTAAAALQRWSKASPGDVVADAAIAADMARAKRIKAAIKRLEGDLDRLTTGARAVLGEKTTLFDVTGRRLATWNQTKGRKNFNKKLFGERHPGMLEKYTSVGRPGRQFLIK